MPLLPSSPRNLLLLAAISKTLSRHHRLPSSFRLSETLVLQFLRRPSVSASEKSAFFKWALSRPEYSPSSAAFSLALSQISRSDHEDIRPILSSMRDRRIAIDMETLKVLIYSAVRTGKFDLALEILEHVEETGAGFDARVYCSIIVALIGKNEVVTALSIFDKMLNCDDVRVNLDNYVCNKLLAYLSKARMREEFKRVFGELMNKGFEFDTRGYNICIRTFGLWGGLGVSLELFKRMKQMGKMPDLCTYNALLVALCAAGKLNHTLAVFDELSNSGHEPDDYSYRIVIQGCCKANRVDDAIRIFTQMQTIGWQPSIVIYNSIIDGLFKVKRMTEACKLFEKMVKEGVRPTCCTYDILIDGLLQNGRHVAAYSLFCDLKKKGQHVDAISYSIIVLHLVRNGRIETSLELVEEMEARGFHVDLVTITGLLIGLHKLGRHDCAEMLLKHIRESDLVLSVHKWGSDVEAAMRAPQDHSKDFDSMFPSIEDVDEFFTTRSSDASNDLGVSFENNPREEAHSPYVDNCGWSPSPYMDKLSYEDVYDDYLQEISMSKGLRVEDKGTKSFDMDMVNTYMSIFLAKGKLTVACKLFEIFTKIGREPVFYTYNSLMSSFVKKGYFNVAWGVFIEMREKLCPADIATYNAIIQGLGKAGKADLACSVLNQLLSRGAYLDIVMYNTLINALGKAGRLDEARSMFEKMKDSGISPDIVTFNTLIEIHTRQGRVREAYDYLKMMIGAGCPPNRVTDTILVTLDKEIEKLKNKKEFHD